MLTREKFASHLEKYVSGIISPEEHSELFACIASGTFDTILQQHINNNLQTNNASGADLPSRRAAEILHKIISSERQNALLLPVPSRRVKMIRRISVAATIIAVAISVYFFFGNSDNGVIIYSKDLKETINKTNAPLKIQMEDSSFIILQPGSAIHYPQHFLSYKREVFLDGDAFFEVSKNAHRPFYVYNKNIVTHVLGTSFNVKVNKETQQVEVTVRSGRVEVYENRAYEKDGGIKNNNGVILLPNQKVVYNQQIHQFVPSLVNTPLPLINKALTDKKDPEENIVFDETPLKNVLGYLEKTYGIEIVAENENIYKCLFTGDVNHQDLYTRLDIICQSVQASYEVKGTRILIKGKGCN
jgi:transmembrane sensor